MSYKADGWEVTVVANKKKLNFNGKAENQPDLHSTTVKGTATGNSRCLPEWEGAGYNSEDGVTPSWESGRPLPSSPPHLHAILDVLEVMSSREGRRQSLCIVKTTCLRVWGWWQYTCRTMNVENFPTFQAGNRKSILWKIWPAQEEKSGDTHIGNFLQTAQWDHSSVMLKSHRSHDYAQSTQLAFAAKHVSLLNVKRHSVINRYLRKASNMKERPK